LAYRECDWSIETLRDLLVYISKGIVIAIRSSLTAKQDPTVIHSNPLAFSADGRRAPGREAHTNGCPAIGTSSLDSSYIKDMLSIFRSRGTIVASHMSWRISDGSLLALGGLPKDISIVVINKNILNYSGGSRRKVKGFQFKTSPRVTSE
jgi:hypothetical protein